MNGRATFAVCALLACGACGGSTADAGEPTGYVDAGVVACHNLGPLGGASHPATRDVVVTIDGERRHPGGLVVRHVEPGAPLVTAGVSHHEPSSSWVRIIVHANRSQRCCDTELPRRSASSVA